MKGKKFFIILTALIVLSLLLGACQQSGDGAGEEPETLRVWITWGDNPAQIQELFNRYGEANNVTVEVTAPVEDDKVLAGLTGSDPPDVLVLSGGDLVKSYAEEGLVTTLNEYIDTAGIDLDDIFEAPLQQCKAGEEILCLPWGTDIYALFWNKDLFEDAGLDPETPPATMEELVEFADKLTIRDDNGDLVQVGFIPDFSWSHLDLYVRMMGGFWYTEDGTELRLDSTPMVDAMNWEQQFYTKYGTEDVLTFTSALGGYMSPDMGFYSGKVAMMVDGEWQVGPNFISNLKPELNYGVAPFPYPEGHPERALTGVVQGTVALIPSGVENKEAAAKLLGWMMSPEIVAEEMYANFNLPTNKQAAEDPRFLENEKFQVFMDLMASPNAHYIITTPISVELNDEIYRIEEQVLHAGADPLTLLEAAQEEYSPKLEEALTE